MFCNCFTPVPASLRLFSMHGIAGWAALVLINGSTSEASLLAAFAWTAGLHGWLIAQPRLFTCAPAAVVSLRETNALKFADRLHFVSSAASSESC